MKHKKVLFIFYSICLLFLVCVAVGVRWWQDRQIAPSRQICNNLLEARYIANQQACVVSDEPTYYLPLMFPVGKTDVTYLETGLQGFEKNDTISGVFDGHTWYRVFYKINTGIIDYYIVDFTFRNGVLTGIRYSG